MLKLCQQCGAEFSSGNPRRLFCCDRCRRLADNARKKAQRAEAREDREVWLAPFPDPWERDDAALAGALLDTWTAAGPEYPCGYAVCAYETVAGPIACQQCPILQEQRPPCNDCPWHLLELSTAARRNHGPGRKRRFNASLLCASCVELRRSE